MNLKQLENEWRQKWFQYILDHPEKDWDYKFLSCNPNVTWEMIQANPQMHWDFQGVSKNSNVKSS